VETFATRLLRSLDERGPLCVGIDPHPSLLTAWGLTDTPAGLDRFCRTVVDALADRIAVLKPQSAFFERFGSAGIGVLESTIRQSRQAGALVLLDVKRGDIGSTASAYADAYLAPDAPLRADAVTVSPYLGFGALEPFLVAARVHGGGVFVVALSSNPEGRTVQHARGADGRSVAQAIVDDVAGCNEGEQPMGSIGVVVGATAGGAGRDGTAGGRDGTADGHGSGETGLDLSRLNGPVLAPGLGAQGATADDLTIVFKGLAGVIVPAYAREILRHGPDVGGLREAAKRSLAECRKVR
jgi:orotidine-5'-phosphate decarboxylase